MNHRSDDWRDQRFEDPLPLPAPDLAGRVDFETASIAYAVFGEGFPVVLLHGALGNADDWGNQISALLEAGFAAVVIDNRGRGRSSAGEVALSYELMAAEVMAVADHIGLDRFSVCGWSDGAIVGLILAMRAPDRIERVVAYASNMDLSGARADFLPSQAMSQSFERAKSDYARLSETPDGFQEMLDRMNTLMQTQPNFDAADIGSIESPVAVLQGEFDEFIMPEHAAYIARTVQDGQLVELAGVSHFAPWQDPDGFNAVMLEFLTED